MIKRFTKKLSVFLFPLLFLNTALAETFISISDGNWNDETTWNQMSNPINTVPGLNDIVMIDGHEVTINSDVGEVKSVFVTTVLVNNDSKLIMLQGGRLTTTFDLIVEAPSLQFDTEVILSGDAILTVGANATFTRKDDNMGSNILRLQMIDNSSMFVGTNFGFTYGSSSNVEATEEILLKNNAHLTISNNTTFDVRGGNGFEMAVDSNAIVDIGGLLSATIQTTNSLNINATNGGTININDELDLHNHNSPIGIVLLVDDNGSIDVGSSINMTSYNADMKITLVTDASTESVISVASNISFNAQSEGDILINLKRGRLEIGGNFERPTNFGSITMGEISSLVYNGTSPQIIACNRVLGGGTDEFEVKNVVFDNTEGFTTEGPLVIESELNLNGGIIETTAAKPIIISDEATIIGGAPDAFVSGPIHKEGRTNGAAFIFPTGKANTYAPIEVSPITEVGSILIAEYKGDPPPYIDSVEDEIVNGVEGLSHVSRMEHWTLSRTGGSEDIQIALHWMDTSQKGIDDMASLVVAQLNPADSTWYNSGAGVIVGNLNIPGSVETGDPPPYIEAFTFASTLPTTNALPVELTRFEGRKSNDNKVQLYWETASELNSDYFVVERSENGLDFYPLDRVKSTGTTNEMSSYKAVDEQPFYGMNYYRLRQVDLDGEESFSDAIVIKFDVKSGVLLFPNPVLDDINIRLENEFDKDVLIEIFDQSGRLVFAEEFDDVSKYMKLRTIEVNIRSRGTYFMKIHTSTETIIQKFMAGY